MIKRFEGNGRMSRVVQHGDVLYLCGQTNGEDSLNVKYQTTETIKKVEALLEKYGSDKRHILSAQIFLKNIEDFEDMNSVWDAWVEDGFEPARACTEAKLARENILVEILVVAAVK